MSDIMGLPKTAIPLPMDELIAFCERWQIIRLEVFGSILRDDFDPERSDVDFMVTFAPEQRWSLFDLMDLNDDLEVIMKRKVDVVEREMMEKSKNIYRRDPILNSARDIYVR